ncbi:hypothetical protein FA13DRAFT_596624 [Coprinellus micaceus]|uniref:DUF6533 domain-containing protein n=1 Tax=Coprinellus micaceus TaxID=71717 RepID=A0A4Y7T797_COPMI|nr:hypothetical protein FA13DRAFT_596624 [Coprinellus micaceus]
MNNVDIEKIAYEKYLAYSTECAMVAAGTLYICDYFSTLEAEFRFVWAQDWALGKVLFLLVRYWVVFELIFWGCTDALPETIRLCTH